MLSCPTDDMLPPDVENMHFFRLMLFVVVVSLGLTSGTHTYFKGLAEIDIPLDMRHRITVSAWNRLTINSILSTKSQFLPAAVVNNAKPKFRHDKWTWWDLFILSTCRFAALSTSFDVEDMQI